MLIAYMCKAYLIIIIFNINRLSTDFQVGFYKGYIDTLKQLAGNNDR